jgi:hypothetical protein
MGRLLDGEELVQYARKLGVDIVGELRTQSSSGRAPQAPDYELQRRVIEVERGIRESRLWIVALISMIVSVLSTVIALVAVMKR